MITVSNLSYRYKAQPVLQVDAFQLAAGEHAIVLGPSGCGKSTFLHLLAGILTPQSGQLHIDGADIKGLGQRAIDTWRGKNIGFLPQRLALVPSLTVTENLLLSCYANGMSADRERAQTLLQSLGLSDKAKSYPHQLSGGQKQRVAIARAVFNRPKLLLADEPTANLDDAACNAVLKLLTTQAREVGASLVIATHDARVSVALPSAASMRLAAKVATDTTSAHGGHHE
ncbi:MAG TPA: ABC transporter ATP-binding protein [Burkholderiaceae bacterium]|jgi:putative ABC transport system ATP-binding protein|nr:ABC transporter ATP-binding protein [Burkholderiaceae bacterium]